MKVEYVVLRVTFLIILFIFGFPLFLKRYYLYILFTEITLYLFIQGFGKNISAVINKLC